MKLVETCVFVGGPADGTRQAFDHGQLPMVYERLPKGALPSGERPGRYVYERGVFHSEGGTTYTFWKAPELSYDEVLTRLFLRYIGEPA